MKALYFLLSAAALFAPGCGSRQAVSELDSNGNANADEMRGLDYGSGYDTLRRLVKGDCVTSDGAQPVDGATGQTVTYAIEKVDNTADLAERLNVSASASGGFAIFSASAKANYIKERREHVHSTYILARVQVRNAPEVLRGVKLSTTGENGLAQSPSRFSEMCGDAYVFGRVPGGELVAIYALEAGSVQEKEDIQTSLQVNGGLFSASAELKTQLEKVFDHKRVSLRVFESGGNTEDVALTADELILRASTFTSAVQTAPRTLAWIFQDYDVVPKNAPTEEARRIKALVLGDLDRHLGFYLEQQSSLNYVLRYQANYELPSGTSAVQTALNSANANIQSLSNAVRGCVETPSCDYPSNLQLSFSELPKEKPDLLLRGLAWRAAAVCGVKETKEGRHSSCGLAGYEQEEQERCGPREYKYCANLACGKEPAGGAYRTGSEQWCGAGPTRQAPGCDANDYDHGQNKEEVGRCGFDDRKAEWVNFRSCERHRVLSCNHSNCGVARWNACDNPAKPVYNSCVYETTYNSCWVVEATGERSPRQFPPPSR